MTAPSPGAPSSPYTSFWMGGFEGADHVNGFGTPLDMAAVNGHIEQLDGDHRRAAELGIRSVRETIGWRLAEVGPGHFDLRRACRIAESARRHGLQVIWTLMHYGTPADVRLTDDAAIDRFATFAAAVARTLGPLVDEAPVYNLVNEISFLAWAVSHTNMMSPYRNDPGPGAPEGGSASSGYEVKQRLVRMVLAGIEAVRGIDPRARFLHVEPLVHVVAPQGRPELAAFARQVADYQWQAWDLLAGRGSPELGGEPRALDLLGINHYHSSQWEAGTEDRLWWHRRDARRVPFVNLLEQAWERYGRPMIVAETSHFGEGRGQWLNEIASDVSRARALGLPVHGICLYPLVDRPDWSDLSTWHHSGLWGVAPALQRRVLCTDYATVLRQWQARLPSPAVRPPAKPTLLVVSHLRWDFLQHRPQHLLTRLARRFHVLFLEEPLPCPDDGSVATKLECISHGPDIDVLLPRTPLSGPGFSDAQLAQIAPLLTTFLADQGASDCIVWFYTPLAQPLLAGLTPRAIVYDCIDDIAGFANSPAVLAERERELLRAADLVFVCGPALQRAKSSARAEVRCVPNGVDAAHFAPEGLDADAAEAAQARLRRPSLPGPRLGYCGAIDERIDLALIQVLADTHPDWQIVMAGPVLKVDADALPRRPNIHWLGHQPYARLPWLLADWDVCLMPFAQTAVTRAMNPTKTLEYMAAEKPIVSTPVPDVVALYRDTVRIAASHPGFVAACEEALREPVAFRHERIARQRIFVRRASWDARAEAMLGALTEIVDGAGVAAPLRRLAA